jgi:hypothetical protein
MAKNRKFGDLSKDARDRAARIGKRDYGLDRRAVRERYNRGTYNPFARGSAELRIPAEFRHEAVITETGAVKVDWSALALSNMKRHLGDYFKWNQFEVVRNISHAPEKVQRAMAMATEDELVSIAHIQNPEESAELPLGLDMESIGYYVIGPKSGKQEWINIFWYH